MNELRPNSRGRLNALRLKEEMLIQTFCSEEENRAYAAMLERGEPLPAGVYQEEDIWGEGRADSFYPVLDGGLTEAEAREYLLLRQLAQLRVIKGCVIFFTVLTALSLVGAFILYAG